MNQIQAPANPTPDFGYDFNYAVWTPGTTIDLVNVPWNNDYRDVVKFSNNTALNSYINGLKPSGITISQMTYLKPNQPIRINVPLNRVLRYNYLRASNPLQPIPNGDVKKDFYYFILDAEYVAPNTTQIILQLDVWATYINEVTLGNCYVERGHIGIANSNQMDHFGRDYLSIPDGLDIGSNYRTISQSTIDIAGFTGYSTLQSLTNVLIIATTDLLGAAGTKENPNMNTSPGSSVQGLGSGASAYLFENPSSFKFFMDFMKEYPWITQGIVSATMVPDIKRYVPDFVFEPNGVPTPMYEFTIYPKITKTLNNWRDKVISVLPERFKHLNKFLTSPYCMVEMTTWSGTPIQLKPELWNRPDMMIQERINYLPPNQRVQFYPKGYNTYATSYLSFYGGTYDKEHTDLVVNGPLSESQFTDYWNKYGDMGDDYGDYLDMVTQITSFPQVPVVNNMALNYLASNVHSLAYAQQSADWSQQRALRSAQASYDVATGAIRTNQDLTNYGIQADVAQTGNVNRTQAAQAVVSAIAGPVQGAAGGAFTGTPYGVAVGAVTGAVGSAANAIQTGIQIASNDEALAIRNLRASRSLTSETRQGALSRDTNKSLADWAAKGDYENAIAAVNAKIQDATLIQPSVSGQFGGDAMNMVYGTMELALRVKLIDLNAINVVGNYWLRYGYPVRRFMQIPATFKCMENFTYWKLSETYIKSSGLPEGFKQVIRGIFEKGVTVWANPTDIGAIDIADNAPLEGISY